MFVEQFFSFEVLVRRNHYVIEIAICNLEIIEIADVAFC